jgi:hypothetical protein
MKTESKNPAVSHVIANGKIEFMFGVKTERDIDAIDKKEASEFALDYPK